MANGPVPNGTRVLYHGTCTQYHGEAKIGSSYPEPHPGSSVASIDGYRYDLIVPGNILRQARRQSFTLPTEDAEHAADEVRVPDTVPEEWLEPEPVPA